MKRSNGRRVKRSRACDRCGGTGEISVYFADSKRRVYEQCPDCKGKRRVVIQ